MKIEVIMNELRNTALSKDVKGLDNRIRMLEGAGTVGHSRSLVSPSENDELKLIVKGVLTDLKHMKESFN
jgi:hypothetical protein